MLFNITCSKKSPYWKWGLRFVFLSWIMKNYFFIFFRSSNQSHFNAIVYGIVIICCLLMAIQLFIKRSVSETDLSNRLRIVLLKRLQRLILVKCSQNIFHSFNSILFQEIVQTFVNVFLQRYVSRRLGLRFDDLLFFENAFVIPWPCLFFKGVVYPYLEKMSITTQNVTLALLLGGTIFNQVQ